jgi:hypothetical protein
MAAVRSILSRSTTQTIIALTMTAGFLYGFVAGGIITADQFNVAFALVLGFFFGNKANG